MPVRINDKYYWLVPENLNMSEMIIERPPAFPFKVKIDHFYYIIDYLVSRMDWYDFDITGAYVNINAEKLQAFNHEYKYYLDYLVLCPWDVLRSDKYFKRGQKSRGYKFSNNCEEFVQIEITDHVIYKKIKKTLQEKEKKRKVNLKNYSHLTKWFSQELQIDKKKAVEEIELMYPRLGMNFGLKKRRNGTREADKRSKKFRALTSIFKLEFKTYQYTVDRNIGRFHSNLTNIKKELRKYITYNKQNLVNVDMKSSQPWLSQILLRKEFYMNNSVLNIGMFESVKLICKNNKEYKNKVNKILLNITLAENEEMQSGKGFHSYFNLFNNNEFYRDLSNKLYPGEKYEKDKMKKQVMTIMYSNNRGIGLKNNIGRRLFKERFADVHNLFYLIKKGNHKFLSHLLQRIESFLVVEVISRRLAQERPEMPLFTIHDSIVCPKGNEEYVQAVMAEEIQKYTGMIPQFGLEYWGDQSVAMES